MTRHLEFTIGASGYQSRVAFDGEDVNATALTLRVDARKITTLTIDLADPQMQPVTLRGLFVPDTDPDYEDIREIITSPEFRRAMIGRKRLREARIAADQRRIAEAYNA